MPKREDSFNYHLKSQEHHIYTAFLQLSFAIKLWHFLDAHPIDKEIFDIDHPMKTLAVVFVCPATNSRHTKTFSLLLRTTQPFDYSSIGGYETL